jgi:hypothetical protein
MDKCGECLYWKGDESDPEGGCKDSPSAHPEDEACEFFYRYNEEET